MCAYISREAPLGRKVVGFQIHNKRSGDILLELPNGTNFAHAILALLTHEHDDHLGNEIQVPIGVHTVVPRQIPIMLGYRNKDPNEVIPNRVILENRYEYHALPGIAGASVARFPFSHTTISNDAYHLILPNGYSIFLGTDASEGFKTDQSIERLNSNLKRKVDLLLADAAGYGKGDELTLPQQIERIGRGLQDALDEKLPAIIFTRHGNFGIIENWINHGLLKDRQVLIPPKQMDLINELGLLDRWARTNFNFHPQVLELGNIREQVASLLAPIVISDDKHINLLAGILAVVINTSRGDIRVKDSDAFEIIPGGMTGHSGSAFERILRAVEPTNLGLTHPSRKGQVTQFDVYNHVLHKKDSRLDIGNY